MEIIILEDFLFDVFECFPSIEEDSLRYDDPRFSSNFQHLVDMLEKEHFCCICSEWEVDLDLFFDLPAKWRIREDNIMTIKLLDILDRCGECVCFRYIRY